MDGWLVRAVISWSLALLTLSANAEGVFGVSELKNDKLFHKCYAIESKGSVFTPAHCLNSTSKFYLTSLVNPIRGTPVTGFKKVSGNDLAIISYTRPLPPTGESLQGVVWCRTTSSPRAEIELHGCTHLKHGDSGSLIVSNKDMSMHLGTIYFSGKSSGFSLKYQSIIKNNSNDRAE